jgi:hypothetical protein
VVCSMFSIGLLCYSKKNLKLKYKAVAFVQSHQFVKIILVIWIQVISQKNINHLESLKDFTKEVVPHIEKMGENG